MLQTLKNVIRIYCFETEEELDEGMHLLLISVRGKFRSHLGSVPLIWSLVRQSDMNLTVCPFFRTRFLREVTMEKLPSEQNESSL